MDNAIIQALRRARQAYMTNVGEPAAQLVGGGVRGYLGLDAPGYADSRGMEAYRNAAAISNTPVVGMPSMAVRAGARAAPAVAESLRKHAKGFQEYNRALGPAGASQMVVWHGSPHKFDAFDASKIGTGEGAQVYGHGLYLAESPSTAEFYKGLLTDRFPAKLDGRPAAELSTAQRSALGILNDYGGNVDSALAFAKRDMQKAGNVGAEFHVDRYNTLLDIKKGKAAAEVASPSLYKVDLPDEKIARMLDWDKPLSQQPKAFQDAVSGLPRFQDPHVVSKTTAGEAYGELAGELGNRARASEALRQRGIPGIRYLDRGSRGVGQGTSNFVVFPGEEAALTILERNNEIINALRKKKQQ